jgi:hypothetical protein
MTTERRDVMPFLLRFRLRVAAVDPRSRASDIESGDEGTPTVAAGETRVTEVGRETTDDS